MKTFVILGLGREGMSSYRFLRAQNPEMNLILADRRENGELDAEFVTTVGQDDYATFKLGSGYLNALDDLTPGDTIVRSPGVSPFLHELEEARERGVRFTSQTQLFLELYRDRVIGVTGTKGKSTTASLITHILKTVGKNAVIVGNIGTPPLDLIVGVGTGVDASTRLPERGPIIFELSAHQLYDVTISPHIAVILDITEDHLDYYPDRAAYVAAKGPIARYQTADDHVIYPEQSADAIALIGDTPAHRHGWTWGEAELASTWIDDEMMHLHGEQWMSTAAVPLLGRFNLANVISAALAASLSGVDASLMPQAIRTFAPLQVRLEKIGTFQYSTKSITFYDDSLATTPVATIAALDTLGDKVRTLIIGGQERNADFGALARRIANSSVDTLVLLSTVGQRIWQQLQTEYPDRAGRINAITATTMDDTVRACYEHTPDGDIVLLSTAAPSFGMFTDYREKSQAFHDAIHRFKNKA